MSDRDILAPKKGACGDTIYLFIVLTAPMYVTS